MGNKIREWMKIKSLVLLLSSTIFFTGCGGLVSAGIVPVNHDLSKKYPVLYEVAYDHECVSKRTTLGVRLKWSYKKGQRFIPKDVGGTPFKAWGSLTNGTIAVFPENAIGLPISSRTINSEFEMISYVIIYPDGRYTSDNYQMVQYYEKDGILYAHTQGKDACESKDSKPLFKKVTYK